MKFNTKELSVKLNALKSIANVKFGQDLQGVLLKNNLLIANNLKTEMIVPISKEEDSFECIIPPVAIDFISSLHSDSVELVEEDNQLTVVCESVNCKFATRKGHDYPETNTSLPDENNLLFRIDKDVFQEAVKQVLFACAKQNASKPAMEGVLFEGENDCLNIVACDGFRVAWKKISMPSIKSFKAVLNKEVLQKLLSLAEGDLSFYIDGITSIVITVGDYQIRSKLFIASQFIDFRAVFPTEYIAVFSVKRDLLLDCFNRLSICIANKKTTPAIFEQVKSDLINISSADQQVKLNETIPVDSDAFEKSVKIGMNVEFMKEALKASSQDNLIIKVSNSRKPLIISDSSLNQIIMPVRLKGI